MTLRSLFHSRKKNFKLGRTLLPRLDHDALVANARFIQNGVRLKQEIPSAANLLNLETQSLTSRDRVCQALSKQLNAMRRSVGS